MNDMVPCVEQHSQPSDRHALWRRNRQQLVMDLQAGRTLVTGRPVHLKLELTNYCNLSCPMCPHDSMRRPVGYMDPSLFRRIIDEAVPTLEFAYVHHLGESLFHGRIGELISYGERRGVRMGLSTNATFLDDRKSRALLDAGLTFLVISLDAASEQSYGQMRRGGDFHKTVHNIERLLRLRHLERHPIRIVVQMIVSAHNEHEVTAFAQRWPDLVVLKQARDWAGQVPLSSLRPKIQRPSDSIEHAQLSTLSEPCRLPWSELTVLWDGNVVPCANVFEHENLLGDLRVQSLAEVWNGEPIQRLRRAHLRNALSDVPVCRTCPRHALCADDFVAVDQLSQRLRNYVGGTLSPRSGLS